MGDEKLNKRGKHMGHSKISSSRADFYYYFFRNFTFALMPILLLSVMALSLSCASADNSSLDNIMVSIPSSCTLSANITAEHSLSTLGGTYADDIGSTTLKTLCNDTNGFAIYAIGSSRSNEGSTVLASSLGEEYDIATGTATSGNTSNWAMKLTTDSEATYPITLESNFATGSYVSVPGTWTKVASRTSGTDTATEAEAAMGASLNTTYSVYVTPAQPAGTYIGQVKYVLLHPNTNENFMTLEMAFDRYVGPEHKISLDGSATAPKYYRMQDMTSEICQAATTMGGGAQMQLIDDRINLDGEKRLYWVAKLADGNCWMTQNLDLDLIAGHTYTHTDTDLGWSPNNFDANATWTLTGGPSTIAWDSEAGAFTGWQNSNTLPYSANPGEKYYYTSNSTANDIQYNSMQDCVNAGHTDCEHYHAGNYYNWTSAIAQNISNNSNPTTSICPAKWRLPNTEDYEFSELMYYGGVITSKYDTWSGTYNKDGFKIIRNQPIYFVRSGIISNGVYSTHATGQYWSGTFWNSGDAHALVFGANRITLSGHTNSDVNRYLGESLRCLSR